MLQLASTLNHKKAKYDVTHFKMGIYQVQTNPFVQTSILAPGSTSKGYGELVNFTINRPPLITLLQIPSPTLPTHPLDVDPVVQIKVCTVCTKRLVA